MQRRLAQWFMIAGSPKRAAAIYRTLTTKDAEDRADYAGLGEAELEDGQYRDAHIAFFRAFVKNPNDASIRDRLELLNTVTSLDPTPRQLPTAEKYRRSLQILAMARASLEACGVPPDEVARLRAEADAAAAKKADARITNELAEQVLELAEKLWRARVKSCSPVAAGEDPLRLIMEKLAG